MRNTAPAGQARWASTLATFLLRYGLALVIGWIGYAKFFRYEAEAIQPLVATSPLMSWLYDVFSVTTFSTLLGVVEVITAVLLCTHPISARLSLAGAAIAIVLFLTTLSFLVTSPNVFESPAGGFPHLGESGEFLIKDAVLLGAALWAFADSWQTSWPVPATERLEARG